MEETNSIVEKIHLFLDERNIDGLEKYIDKNNIDFNIVKEYIKDNSYLTLLLNRALNLSINKNNNTEIKLILSLLDLPSNNDLLTQVLKRNNIDIADILIDKGVSFPEDIIKDIYDSNNLNFYNLKYILSNGFNILENDDENINNSLITRWVKSFQNKYLEIYLRYINKGNKKLDIKNEYYKIAIEKKNYDGFLILFDNDNRDINDILYYVLNLFNYDKNGFLTGEKYNDFISYIDTNKPFKEMDFYYNGRFGNEDKCQYSFIDEKKFNLIRLKIKNYIETYMNSMHEIVDNIIKDDKIDKSKFEEYIKKNSSVLETLKNEKFDILICAIENNVSKEVIEKIIDSYSDKNFNYGIKVVKTNNDKMKITKKFIGYINHFQNSDFTNQNLKYHYDELYDYPTVESDSFKFKSCINYSKTPLFAALSINKFDIADLLIEKGSDINFNNDKEDIIYSLYYENLLNCENLKYILNHGYKIPKCCQENDNKIYIWIKSFDNNYLEIYLKYLQSLTDKNKQSQLIKNQYYLLSLYYENYNAVIVLFNFDYTEKNEINILYKLYILFKKDDLKYKKFLERINDDKLLFKIENFYCNDKSYNICNKEGAIEESYINESKYKQIKNKIYESFNKLDVISKRSRDDIKKQVINIIKNESIVKLKNYIETNYVVINELSYGNGNSFDILIYSIQNNSSKEMIEYIVSLYDNLNYSRSSIRSLRNELLRKKVHRDMLTFLVGYNANDIENSEDNSNEFKYQFEWNVPLYTAIANNNFDIANMLMKNGANINYEKDVIKYLYDENHLNSENLKFILRTNEYNNNKDSNEIITSIDSFKKNNNYNIYNLIKEWIIKEKNQLLEIYLKYCNKNNKLIKTEYYECAIQHNNYTSFIILFDNDSNNKNEIIYEIIKIICCNFNDRKFTSFSDDEDDQYISHIVRNEHRVVTTVDSDYKEREKYKNFIRGINSLNFNKEFYFNNCSSEEIKKNIFINTIKLNNIKLVIKKNIDSVGELLEKRFEILKLLKNNDKIFLEKYIKDNNIKLNSLNTYDFDVLIYSIENNISEDLIEYMVSLKNYDTLNYHIKYRNKYNSVSEDSYRTTFKTPLVCAIENNKFKIADLLLKYGYDINYSEQFLDENDNIKDFDIIEYLYNKDYFGTELSCYGLMYLLINGYIIKNSTIIEKVINKITYNNGKNQEDN